MGKSAKSSDTVAWFLAGVISGMTLAYTVKSLVDYKKREETAWTRAWENSSQPVTFELEDYEDKDEDKDKSKDDKTDDETPSAPREIDDEGRAV